MFRIIILSFWGFFSLGLVCAGLFSFYLGYLESKESIQFLSIAQEAGGKIHRVKEKIIPSTGNKLPSKTYIPEIVFSVPDTKKEYVFQGKSGDYKIDEEIVVLYDPGNPNHAKIKDFNNLLNSGIGFIIGIALMGGGILILYNLMKTE